MKRLAIRSVTESDMPSLLVQICEMAEFVRHSLRWDDNAFRSCRNLGAKVMDNRVLLRLNGRKSATPSASE